MLPNSHYRAYQDFLTLLIDFDYLLRHAVLEINQNQIELGFEQLQHCYERQIFNLGKQDVEPKILSRWQTIQREIQREFKLLSAGILFLLAARKETTKQEKLNNILHNTTKLIDYCQIMIPKDKE